METMLAARLHIPSHTLSMAQVPKPVPGQGEVLIKVEAAGVCLSDVHLIDGSIQPSLLQGDTVTLGHEVAGTVAELGTDVAGLAVGDRVVLQAGEERDGVIYTRGVDYDGGWAEYALATAGTVLRIPDSLSFEQAAIIPDAVSTPWAAITVTGEVKPAQAVGVWGVGGLGAHAVQLLRTVGAYPIIAVDPNAAARARAAEFGADLVLDAADPELRKKIRAATEGKGIAVAFDFAGVPAVREQVVRVLAYQGRLVLVGIVNAPLTVTQSAPFVVAQQQIRGHYGSEVTHVPELVRLTEGGRLDLSRSISGTFPLAEAAEVVDRLVRKEGDPIRLILRP
ncbi:zinc-binding dehydrogenase [Nocardia altamirensis]|uniref:zinc-binding dehydrogenase n=1 Tax=Nocardia altamirensis TaxID=472158 RepID=UPI0008405003|nr:zinc-binding dehydrogenase [Nocardia altamirensis]